jgi:hypothetical protein
MKRIEFLMLPLVIAIFAFMAGTVPVAAQGQTKAKRAIPTKAVSPPVASSRAINVSQRDTEEYVAFVAQLARAQQNMPDSFEAFFKVFEEVTVETLELPISQRRALAQTWTSNLREKTSATIAAFQRVQAPPLTSSLNRQIRGQLAARDMTITIVRGLDISMERLVDLVLKATPQNQAQTIRSIDIENFSVNSKRISSISTLNETLAESLPETSPSKSGILAISCYYKALATVFDIRAATISTQAAGQVFERQATEMKQHNQVGRVRVRTFKTQLNAESALPGIPARVRTFNTRIAVILEDYNGGLAISDQIADRMEKAAILLRNGESPAETAMQEVLTEMGTLELQMMGLINGVPAKIAALP